MPEFVPSFRLAVRPLLLALLLGVAPAAAAQTFTTLCAGQTGTALHACLRAAHTPAATYPYARARDTLFAFVDDGDRTRITDVYAGNVLPIPPGADPTNAGCNGDGDGNASTCSGAANVQTEHAYPQSKGAASGPAQSDLHHLYPARADVNLARSNFAYGAFSNADTWKYFLGQASVTCSMGGCPPANASAHSAVSVPFGPGGASYFMPRASVRGDLARALFYFYTIYRAQADAADPAFFESMRTVLLAWHRQDPVTAEEQARSARVRRYQGNDNPFVLDSSLARRAYDPGYAAPSVDLTAFTATPEGPSVHLRWTTARETNAAGFVPERRIGEVWTQAAPLVAAHGTTAEPHDYALRLDHFAEGRHTLRLRLVDTEGRASYGPAVEVTVVGPVAREDEAFAAGVRVGPQPARDRVSVTLAAPPGVPLRVAVVDVLGRERARLYDGFADAGTQTFGLDVRALAPGRYAVRLDAGGRTTFHPLVVAR